MSAPSRVADLPTDTARIAPMVEGLRRTFASGRTRPQAWRLEQLGRLRAMVREHEAEFIDALRADVGKPPFESFTAEVAFTYAEIALVTKGLPRWMKPARVRTPLSGQPGRSAVYKDPLGVVLVIGPWNYPLQLTLAPLIGAIAAGNCVVLKPSEVSPATSALLARHIPRYLDAECVHVVEGAVAETQALLAQRWDHVFYTGNGTVGRIVMEAAARHLTPVTLELGGKSPCLVDRDIDIDLAARRIAWGKFWNAGQTCTAPDYVLVPRDREGALLAALSQAIRAFYGDDPRRSPHFARIVNARHHQRVRRLLDGGGDVVIGGEAVEAERYIAPTVLRNVRPDAAIMQEEIFGPLLPVLTVDGLDEAIAFVTARDKPLALYLFSQDRATQERVLAETTAGGVTINHTILHVANPHLPFGGVGPSGMGAYHGKASFDAFTHHKAVMRKGTLLDPDLVYSPYTDAKFRWVKRLL